MTATAVALVPNFVLIAFGLRLARLTRWSAAFWEAVERMTYSALLFYANARARIELGAADPPESRPQVPE